MKKSSSIHIEIPQLGEPIVVEWPAEGNPPDAQSDLGILCLEQERADIALHWFNLAAEQGHADAMHFLSKMYQSGDGVERSESTSLL